MDSEINVEVKTSRLINCYSAASKRRSRVVGGSAESLKKVGTRVKLQYKNV